MDRLINYALSLFSILTDQDKDEIISLMLSCESQREPASAQKE